jgi:hypothetical protein
MVVAERETVSVLGNNWVNLCCRNLRAMDVDAIELVSKYRLTRQLENWQKVGGSLTEAGFQAVAHLSGSIKKRSDGDIQRITSSCLLHWQGLNVREPTFSAPPDCWETVLL